MTNEKKRKCIKCEIPKDVEKDFKGSYPRFCDNCYGKMENNDEARRFENCFLDVGQWIFAFEYPEEIEYLAVTLPKKDDEKAKRRFINEAKLRVETYIKNRSDSSIERQKANVKQAEDYQQWINHH